MLKQNAFASCAGKNALTSSVGRWRKAPWFRNGGELPLPANSGLPELAFILSKSDKSDFDWERVGVRGSGPSIDRTPSPGSHLSMRSDLSHKGRGNALRAFADSMFKQTVIASEAKQSNPWNNKQERENGLLRRGACHRARIRATRWLLAMTANPDTHPHSRGARRPRFAGNFPPSPIRGRRECRAPDAPDSRACRCSGRTHTR
jgi:hypothetical protein